MKQLKKAGKIKRRLLAVLCCISLLTTNLAMIPAWAREPDAEQTQNFGKEPGTDNEIIEEEQVFAGAEDGSKEQQTEDERQEEAQVPEEESDGSGGQVSGEEGDGSGGQVPSEEDDGSGVQESGGENDGDDVQDSGQGDEKGEVQESDGKNDAEGTEPTEDEKEDGEDGEEKDDLNDVTDDVTEEPEIPGEEEISVSENTVSVSGNDLEERDRVHTLTVPEDAIASGSYGNVTWVIDADGKLTVEGTGEFRGSGNSPWYSKRSYIKSAVVRLKDTTNAREMFNGCSALTSIDLSGFDTGSVTDMGWMFSDCSGLTSIDLSNFDTGSVTNMSRMFYNCWRLGNLDLSMFDTAAVTTMENMFYGCRGLTGIDISSFRTERVNNMFGMFDGCSELGSLDLRGFRTANVNTMSRMFQHCAKLKSLLIDSFNTSNVTDMDFMFDGCSWLTSLDVSRFDTGKVTNMSYMFAGCHGLTSLDVSSFDTSNVTNMVSMFSECVGMDTIDLNGFDTSQVTNMSSMFYAGSVGMPGCGDGFKRLDLSSFDTSKVANMALMFCGLENLVDLDVSGFDTRQVINMEKMFEDCYSLQEVDVSSFDTSNVMDITSMFRECRALKSIDLSSFSLEALKVTTGSKNIGLFSCCDSLTQIYTPCNLQEPLFSYLPEDVPGDTREIHWFDTAGNEYRQIPNLNHSIYLEKGRKPDAVQDRITAHKVKTTYACGEEIKMDDLTVIYYGADGRVSKLTQEMYTTKVTDAGKDTFSPFDAGEKVLTVTYVNNGVTMTSKVTLTVAYLLSADSTTITLPADTAYDYIYDGEAKQPSPSVSYRKKAADGTETAVALTEGTDYTVSYRNNINAYEQSGAPEEGGDTTADPAAAPTVIIRGKGGYSGTATAVFTIRKADAPAAEEKKVTASQCAQANPKRSVDLTGTFASCGKKTGYEIVSVDDPQSIFSKTPVTADIRGGVLTYGTNAAQQDDTATVTIKVSFVNHKDAELTLRITMVSKKAAVISGITMQDSVYDGTAASYSGKALVKTEDGTDVTGKVTLVYRFSGTMADGTDYPTQDSAPVNAGDYVLTVAVADADPDHTGSAEYPFTIAQAEVVVRADDVSVLMQTPQEGNSSLVPVEQYQSSFGYTVTGLLGKDMLKTGPVYTVTEDEAGTKPVQAIDTARAGTYYIHPSGADAGMNYKITYQYGILTVAEERIVYTVSFDTMGHGHGFTKSGIKAGSLLELSKEEKEPSAEGYLFAGWYKDKSFAGRSKWDFDADTVQSDMTLYACWLTDAAQEGDGLKLCIQEIPDLTYTGSAQKPAVTVYDSDGVMLLKAGKDYTVKYARNTDAVAVDEDGQPAIAGGTASVADPGKASEKVTDVVGHFSKECPYVIITGKGNYSETVYRNFRILPADIGAAEGPNLAGSTDDTPLAAGFTLKYTDQFEAKANKTAKIVNSFKYKKALKADQDYSVSVVDEAGQAVTLTQGKLPLNAGVYTMTLTGKGNYTGAIRRKLYVAEKQRLMKNASVTYRKTIKAEGAEALSRGIEQTAVKVKIGGQEIAGEDYTIDYAGTNHAVGTATMTLTGRNGYVGTKSVTFKITGTAFNAGTVEVKAYDASQPDEDGWRSSMPYTGRAVTQNKVMLTTKVTAKNPSAQRLTYGEDYTITYKNNVKKGTAVMTFTAKPGSGYSGSFKKNFKITAQALSEERLTVGAQARDGAVYCKSGAKLPFVIVNEAGTALCEGTDYTVKYRNNNAVTTPQTAESKKPLMTVTGKGNYTGKVEVSFTIIPASIETAVNEGVVNISCAQVAKKDSMSFKDFKFRLMEGKKTLGVGEAKDYVIDETKCTSEQIKAYADAVEAGTTAQHPEPTVTVQGRGCYTGEKTIPLGDHIYVDKLTASCLYVVVSEGTGQNVYTGGQVTPDVAVYHGEKTAVATAKRDQVKDGAVLTAADGKYKLTKLTESDCTVSYGVNVQAGKKKGSVKITGAGRYGGSVTVKFDIVKKAIYLNP